MNLTKTQRILNALMQGDRLTAYKAAAYGTLRLAAVIHSLRQRGYYIERTIKKDQNGTRFAEYYMPSYA